MSLTEGGGTAENELQPIVFVDLSLIYLVYVYFEHRDYYSNLILTMFIFVN